MSHRATPANTAELTAEIVSAYVSNNETALSDVAALITAVAGQLSRIGTAPDIVEAIVAGRTDQGMLLEQLERPLRARWEEQRERLP